MRIVADSGPLISLSNTCLLGIIKKIPADFLLPPWVIREVIDNPLRTKQYRWSAIRIRQLLDSGYLKAGELGEKGEELAEEIDRISNRIYFMKKRPLRVIQRGEVEALALASMTDGVLLIDERTLRLMLEDPQELAKVLSIRTGRPVRVDMGMAERLQEIVGDVLFIRSADLVAYAYETGLLNHMDRRDVEAILYALKFTGCSVSEQEIKEFLLE